MGFSQSDLEPLAFDFTSWGGQSGDIDEPTINQLNDFHRDWGKMLRDNLHENQQWQKRAEAIPDDDNQEDARKALEDEFEVWQDQHNLEVIQRRRELLSRLCNGHPSVEQLASLPARPFDGFQGYLIRAISPEA